MPDSNADIDELVARGVRELREEHEEGERFNVAAKARELGVHKDRLRRRLKAVGPRTTRKAANPKLSAVQEASLLRYILSLDEIGHSVRYDQISRVANANSDPASSVGQHWARRFLSRHPELYRVKQKPLELERKLAYNPEVLSNWFERTRQLQKKYAVQTEDIWNFDETGF
jgi:Tc5 transposase DNA-binding domain